MNTERIILTLEVVENGKDARCCIVVPDLAEFEDRERALGIWMQRVIRELRAECNQKLMEDRCAYFCPKCNVKYKDPETLGTPWACDQCQVTLDKT